MSLYSEKRMVEIGPIEPISAKTYLFLKNVYPLVLEKGEFCLWLTRDKKEANDVYSSAKFWNKNLNLNYNLYLLDSNEPDFIESLNQFRKCNGLFVMPFFYFLQLELFIRLLNEQTIKLKQNQVISPQELVDQLIDVGYEASRGEERGTFKHRGSVLTIFMFDEERRLKLEFDEEKIIKIKTGQQVLDLVEIIPFKINFDEAGLKKESKNHWSEILNKLHFIYSDPFILEKDNQWTEINEAIKNNNQLIFQTLKPQGEQIKVAKPRSYNKNFKLLADDIKKYLADNWQIIISTIDSAVVENIFKVNQIKDERIKFFDFEPSLDGFILLEDKFLFLTHSNIFGKFEVKKKKIKKIKALDFITDLKVGDYIVHEDHGIGVFRGLVPTKIDNFERENLLLEYAQGDKLYLPIDLTYKVDRYIGQLHPKIHRLSGTLWLQITKKIKVRTKELAKELIKLYAQREIVKIIPWQEVQVEEKELAVSFPYQVTPDQQKAIQEIFDDLEKDKPMDRLIVGDVGFGKTEVAIRAAFRAIMNHKQVAFLCPTTILAQQHYDTFRERLKNFGVEVECLSRFTKRISGSAHEKNVLNNLEKGIIDVVIGTHRLLSEDVKFKDLGLIIIDEEQRFGVRHKEKLKKLRVKAHVLTLTATPIPRTLYFSLSGIRDISTIFTPPKGRLSIETIIEPYDEELIIKAIEEELKRGGQVYYLDNKVETIGLKAAQLKKILPKGVRIDIVHGQMPEKQIAKVMSLFDNGQIDVLVCSSIIENGLDLPNVNTLIVENAQNFGLAQLYQFRGRIGRGNVQAYSYFFYRQENLTANAAKRLQALLEAKELGSGMELATKDLEIRGIGNLLGKEQHGQARMIGLSLYLRLLSQAVDEVKLGEEIKPRREISIDLPFDYTIPNTVIADSQRRIKIYHLLSAAENLADLNKTWNQYFQNIQNEKLNNLYKMFEIRILALQAGVSEINYLKGSILGKNKDKIVILLDYLVDSAKFRSINNLKVMGNKMVLSFDEGIDIYPQLKEILLNLGKIKQEG